MKEKTLRYAGHAALMANYRNAGKFDEERIEQTSNELFDAWRLEEREPEVTIMKIIIQEKSVRDRIQFCMMNMTAKQGLHQCLELQDLRQLLPLT